MKRSAINEIIRESDAFIRSFGYVMPPFAYWSPEEMKRRTAGDSARIRDHRLGWDITDYGQGKFDDLGLFLFTVRNGNNANVGRGRGMLYAEKIMISGENQISPMHRHNLKTEDIINKGGGTLVLEDVEALSDTLQGKLLNMINEQGTPGETRIVAISNMQEADRTCEDALRSDLFYRLAALRITVPPLRQRGEDVLTLFTTFTEQFSEEYGCDAPKVAAQEAAQLLQAPWPGNVRQLINVAERAVLQSRRGSGTIASLLMTEHDDMQSVVTTEGKPLKEYVEAFERMLIDNTMRRHKGSISSVMDELCLPRRTLNEKMAKYGLQRADYIN